MTTRVHLPISTEHVPGGPEGLAAAALGGVAAGYRLIGARLAEPGEEIGGVVELVPPGSALASAPRTRANVPLPSGEEASGDPGIAVGRGLFAPPERFDERPFSPSEAGRVSTSECSVRIETARSAEPTGACASP